MDVFYQLFVSACVFIGLALNCAPCLAQQTPFFKPSKKSLKTESTLKNALFGALIATSEKKKYFFFFVC
jgi:hypothetical protein